MEERRKREEDLRGGGRKGRTILREEDFRVRGRKRRRI